MMEKIFTAKAQRTQRKNIGALRAKKSTIPSAKRRKTLCALCVFAVQK